MSYQIQSSSWPEEPDRSSIFGKSEKEHFVKAIMGVSAVGRNCVPAGDSYQLREPQASYNADFGVENGNIEPENTFEWR